MDNSAIVLDQLASFPTILENLVERIPQQNLQRKLGKEWSVLEQIKHLIKAQGIHRNRIEQFISETNPHIKGYHANLKETEQFSQKTTIELISIFKESRKDLLSLINHNYNNLVSKQGSHDEYEPYNFESLLTHILNVDYAHLFKLEIAGFGKSNL